MKKSLVLIILFLMSILIVGCVNTPNGPGTSQPYGDYNNETMYSMYPYYVSSRFSDSKFEFNHTFEDGVHSTVESLEDIKCESLSKLFNANCSDEYLKENFCALYFIREEPFYNDSLNDIFYYDLFIEKGKIYVTLSYNDYQDCGDAVMSYFKELILIPKEWEKKIYKKYNFEVNYNYEYNRLDIENKYILNYNKMKEFKETYKKQNGYSMQIKESYGEYNNCLIAAIDYGNVLLDIQTITILIEDVIISYNKYYPILVFYEKNIYTLEEAYEYGYLKLEDIKEFKSNYYGKFIKKDLSGKLNSETFIVDENTYIEIQSEYNIKSWSYYVINNYGDYINFYTKVTKKEIEPLDKESGEKMFEDKVILCYLRIESGSEDFLMVDYYYDEYLLDLYAYYSNIEYDTNYPDVEVGHCIDMVEVPLEIYNKLLK